MPSPIQKKTVRDGWSKEVRQLMKNNNWRLMNLTQNCSAHQLQYVILCIIAFSVGKVRRKDGCLGLEVKVCLAMCSDLPAVDAVYHTKYHREFFNERQCSKVRE